VRSPRRFELLLATGLLGIYLVTGNGSPEGALASLLAALVALVAFRLYRRLGAGIGTATLVTLALALTTLLWPAARRDPSAVLETLLFTGFLDALVAVTAGSLRPVVLGAWAAMLVIHDLRFAPAVLGAAVHLGLFAPRGRRVAVTAEMMAPVVVVVATSFGLGLGLGDGLLDLRRYREHVLVGLLGMFIWML
jgi:hypothetical protein